MSVVAHPRAGSAGSTARRLPDGWAVLALPMALFFLLPLAALLWRGAPDRLWASVRQPVVLSAISLSLVTTGQATALSVLLGTPAALLLARRRTRLAGVLDALVDLPTVLPPAVAGVALLLAFGRRGLVGSALSGVGLHLAFTRAAVVMAQGFVSAPLFVRAAAVGFAGVDAELEHAAALDGATPWQCFRSVTVPLAWEALASGAAMAWARALGEFGATIIFAGNLPGRTQTMPLAIYMGFETDYDVAVALSLVLLGLSLLVLAMVKGVLRRTGGVGREVCSSRAP
mgnify:CR=1 FL=1